MIKRPSVVFVPIVVSLCFGLTTTFARDNWISVRSRHVLVIGNGPEKDIRLMALRLEQFREVVTRLFPQPGVDSVVPTTLIVFKDEASYRPFKTSENNAGYFQPGQDVNYITLSAETQGEQDQFNIIFHEYTHLIVNNSIGQSPAWFNEGIAELYSNLGITNNGVVLGRPIRRHLALLHQASWLPLRLLLEVDYKSPYYNEGEKQSIFYAESWALLHYLMLNKNGERAQQTIRFLDLLRSQEPLEQAAQKAFSTSLGDLESDLRSYVEQNRYRSVESFLEGKSNLDQPLTSSSVSEAELQAYLGDLLSHSNRGEAEAYLLRALQLDPQLTFAQGSLGMFYFREGKIAEALGLLARAAVHDSANAFVHYYYASALSRPTQDEASLTVGYAPDVAAKIRTELRKSIALRPDFPDAYDLLAYVNLVTDADIDDTIELLKTALERSPSRTDFMYMLGQLYMHKDDYKNARPLLNQVVAGSVEANVREHAQKLLSTISTIEEQQAKREAARIARGLKSEASQAASQMADDPSASLREALRLPGAGETQVQGVLLSIDCEPAGFTFVVKTSDRVLRLKADTFQQVKRTTFTADVQGTITCGVRKPSNPVVVCYTPSDNQRMKFDGMVRSIEFVPGDFHLVPPTP